MPERHWRMRVGLATSVLALALLVGPVTSLVSHAAWRPRLPLGLDLYMPVPEDNPLTWRAPFRPKTPWLTVRPSVKARSGSWQSAQA